MQPAALKKKLFRGRFLRGSLRELALLAALAICIGLTATWLLPETAAAERSSSQTLKIGSTTYTGKRDNIWEMLLNHLQVRLNAKCELVKADDVNAIVAKLKSRQVQFVYLTPIDYLQAQRQAGVEGLAVQVLPEGKPGYYAVLVAKKSSGIQTLDQAKGKKLGFVAQDSVSGFKIQAYAFLKERKQPASSFFSQTVFAGTHLKVLQGLQKGDFELGATNTKDLKNSCKILGLDPAEFNIIWQIGFIPESVFAARKDLPPDLKKAFANALFSLNQDKELLKALNIGGYAKPQEADFSLIQKLDAFLQKNKLSY